MTRKRFLFLMIALILVSAIFCMVFWNFSQRANPSLNALNRSILLSLSKWHSDQEKQSVDIAIESTNIPKLLKTLQGFGDPHEDNSSSVVTYLSLPREFDSKLYSKDKLIVIDANRDSLIEIKGFGSLNGQCALIEESESSNLVTITVLK